MNDNQDILKFQFSSKSHEIAQKTIAKYPSDRKFSAIMPLLSLAQKQNGGHLDDNVLEYLASYLNVSKMSLYEVAQFYSMYSFKPVGKYHVQICKSVVCTVCGTKDVYELCKALTNTENKDVSDDGLFSVKKVECLGACVNAVALKINNVFYEDTSKEGLEKLFDSLRNGEPLQGFTKVKMPLLGGLKN